MRIGIDARTFNTPIHCGSRRLLNSLITKFPLFDKRYSFFLFSYRKIIHTYPRRYKEIIVKIPNLEQNVIGWEQFALPDALSRHKIAIYHSFNLAVPCGEKRGPTKYVLTMLDVIPWIRTGVSVYAKQFDVYFKRWLPPSLEKADKIIALSRSVKNDIHKIFSISPHRIKVIYPGISDFFRNLPSKDKAGRIVQRHLGIKTPFILNCNVLSPRKNVETLIRAFQRLKLKKGIPHTLVIAGSTQYYKPRIRYSKDILFTDTISDRLLLYLYNLADIFVYPSLYEGFGYPLLEAMACGTPVISSHTSSLPELVGKKGVMFDPRDVRQLSDLIFQVLENKSLQTTMIKNGFERLRYFSEMNPAFETLALYDNVCKN